jgi:hypothetical protein
MVVVALSNGRPAFSSTLLTQAKDNLAGSTFRFPCYGVGNFLHRMPAMATKQATISTARVPRQGKKDNDEARFEAWLRDFDASHADLTMRLDALLRSLGVDPTRASERQPA